MFGVVLRGWQCRDEVEEGESQKGVEDVRVLHVVATETRRRPSRQRELIKKERKVKNESICREEKQDSTAVKSKKSTRF